MRLRRFMLKKLALLGLDGGVEARFGWSGVGYVSLLYRANVVVVFGMRLSRLVCWVWCIAPSWQRCYQLSRSKNFQDWDGRKLVYYWKC